MNIRQIQEALIKLGFNPGVVDGINGPRTRSAVRGFQNKYGLVVDGIAGPQTIGALKQALNPPKVDVRPEPDKSAIMKPAPEYPSSGLITIAPPPNFETLRLLNTSRAIDEIIIHCAATPEGKNFTVDDIRSWHKARGFSDIGYHYVVYRDGRIMLGRPIGQQGAHTADHGKNRGTIGVCYIGGLAADGKTPKDTRTEAQRSSLLWLSKQLASKFPIKRITGHNQYANKACPSFDVRKDPLGRIV